MNTPFATLTSTPFTSSSVLQRWAAERDEPLLPQDVQVKLLPHAPNLDDLMPYIPDEVLQPLVNSFVQVMYLDWLMYEADLRKIEYRISRNQEQEYAWEYATRHRTRLPKFIAYNSSDVQGMASVRARHEKIRTELSTPAVSLTTYALQLVNWQSSRSISSFGKILKYAWCRTNKKHVKELFPRFPVHFSWDWL